MAVKRIAAHFYRAARGAEPVRDWLLELNADDRRAVGHDIGTLEFGWPVGMPICRPLGGGLFEIRCKLAGNRIARVFFCTETEHLVLLHGFIKKSRKTPQAELDLARRRMKEFKSGR